MEGIYLLELRHLLEETTQHRFTADLHEGKYYPFLRAGWVPKPDIIGLINCRTQLSGGEIYVVYYIGINYMFRLYWPSSGS